MEKVSHYVNIVMTTKEILNSSRWRNKVRPQKLRDTPQCEVCEKKDLLEEATHVSHIVPPGKGGEPFEQSNLISLCKRCHIIKNANDLRGK